MFNGLLGGLVQQQPNTQGGLLGAFDQNQMALGMMGMGLLSGQDNRDAFRLGMQGAMQGRQFDVQQNQRRAVAAAIASDPSIPPQTRALLMQMEPSAALGYITAERNYQRELDQPRIHNDPASGQAMVYTQRQAMGRLGGGAPGAPAAPGGGGVAPPAPPSAPSTGGPPAGGSGGLGVPLFGGGETRQQREVRERYDEGLRRGLTGEPLRQYALTGNFTGSPAGYEEAAGGGLQPTRGGPADQPPPGFRWDNPNAPRDQRRAVPIPGGPEERIGGENASRMALGNVFLQNLPQIRREVNEGRFEGAVRRLGQMASTAATGNVYEGLTGEAAHTYRNIQQGVEALARQLTGAGMPANEAMQQAQQYLPRFNDSRATILAKLNNLEAALRESSETHMRGRGGTPSGGGGRADPLGIR